MEYNNNQNNQPQEFIYQAPAAPATETWICQCGTENSGKFCSNCGSMKPVVEEPKPAEPETWICQCGTENTGKFCSNCGSKKPEAAPQFTETQPVFQAPQYAEPQQPVYQAPQYAEPQQPAFQAPQFAQPQQPAYQAPQYQPVQKQSKGLAVTSMILGICSIIFCSLSLLAIPLGIVALILGIIGKKKQQGGMAIAGIITGAIGLLLSVWILVELISAISSIGNGIINGNYNYYYDISDLF